MTPDDPQPDPPGEPPGAGPYLGHTHASGRAPVVLVIDELLLSGRRRRTAAELYAEASQLDPWPDAGELGEAYDEPEFWLQGDTAARWRPGLTPWDDPVDIADLTGRIWRDPQADALGDPWATVEPGERREVGLPPYGTPAW